MSQPTRNCPQCQTPLPSSASFCYVCGTATPSGINRETGETITTTMRSGIGPADLLRKLQRALGPGYELQDRIGAGGFAEVFKVRDLRLKRDLAVKVLRPDLGLSPELLQRFRREAETIAALRNAHIVPVFDVGEAEGLAYIIMPLIAGESLRSVLDREGAIGPAEVRRILREAASGLAAAHEAGIIHRDIKPENIMLEGRDKRVLLMDFGISKAVGAAGDEDPAQALTTTGIIIGTPQYMSPEQACGDKSIDARSDQYSLAVVGYRMLAGGLPFEGESTRAVLYQQLVADAPPIAAKVPGVPTALAAAIQRAMAKEPAERYSDMTEFAHALDASESVMRPAGAPAGASKSKRAPLIGLAAVAILGIGGWAVLHGRGTSEPPVTPPPPAAGTVADAPPPALEPPPAPTTPTPTSTRGGGAAQEKSGNKSNAATAANGRGQTATPPPPPPPAAAPANSCAKLAGASNWSAALPACTKEANAGNSVSQRILGGMYEKGNGVTQSLPDAADWYRKAASQDPEAMFLLSGMLETGRGTPRNDAESMVLLRESATGGWLPGLQRLASRLENGTNTKKDEGEAAVWYRRGAERGDMLSQQKLGEFLAKGRGVQKNETEALVWFQKAGDQGSGDAAWQASQAYFKGRGTEKNDTLGMDWLRKAAAVNQPDAVKELKKRTGAQ